MAAATTHSDRDAEIRRVLSSHGDDGRTPRHAVFYLYGGDVERLERAARAAGYEVRPTAQGDGVVLETITAVDEPTFETHARRMAEWADEFGSEYDGWECQLVKASH